MFDQSFQHSSTHTITPFVQTSPHTWELSITCISIFPLILISLLGSTDDTVVMGVCIPPGNTLSSLLKGLIYPGLCGICLCGHTEKYVAPSETVKVCMLGDDTT